MKFAVVEYASKTGQIWRHTAGRPNYLCDPIKEIDPTSFGCYVSALEGEHIPLSALIKPSVWKKAYKRATSFWPPGYDISYLEGFDALLVVHQLSDAHEMTRLVKRLSRRSRRPVIIGVPTQPFGLLRDAWTIDDRVKRELAVFMDACDVFITVVASTKSAWQALSKTPVIYLPQPYPVQYASQFFTPRAQKDKIIFAAGVTGRHNIKLGHVAAKKLQEEFPEYIIHATDIPGLPLDTAELEGSRFELLPFQHWQEHLQYLARATLVVNSDFTQTRGRVQADCAAVGTPSIGADSDGQVDLFPDLPFSARDGLEALIAQGRRLLADKVFYDEVTKTAQEKLRKYNYEESAKRLIKLINTVRHD